MLEKGHLAGGGGRKKEKERKMHNSENKVLITTLLGGWMRKQGSKELSSEHILEQTVGIDFNVRQSLVV